MSRPFPPRSAPPGGFVKINGKIRAREVRVIGPDGKMMGVMNLNDALNLARVNGVDLVEIAPTAVPPVCRVVDFGKYRYEQAKKEKESKKHQHATTVKEIQLSPRIDPHDLGVKMDHAIDFLCEDMKVKAVLKFRGREMAHTEFGFQVIKKFIEDLAPYGHPDFQPKLIGRSITLMISPLPRNKRAKHPRADEMEARAREEGEDAADDEDDSEEASESNEVAPKEKPVVIKGKKDTGGSFSNNPFDKVSLDRKPQDAASDS